MLENFIRGRRYIGLGLPWAPVKRRDTTRIEITTFARVAFIVLKKERKNLGRYIIQEIIYNSLVLESS